VKQIPSDRSSSFYLLSDQMFNPIRGLARLKRVVESLGLGGAPNYTDGIQVQRTSGTDRGWRAG
jgi:hypothetical protein